MSAIAIMDSIENIVNRTSCFSVYQDPINAYVLYSQHQNLMLIYQLLNSLIIHHIFL